MDIRMIKTMAGELIIGKFHSEDADTLVLDKPYIVVPTQNLQIAPYIPIFETTWIPFNKNSLDIHHKPNEQVKSVYMEMTTKIKVPPKQKLIVE